MRMMKANLLFAIAEQMEGKLQLFEHTRKGFVQLSSVLYSGAIQQCLELNPQDLSAIGIVAQMDELFEIDEKAREEALSPEDRVASCRPWKNWIHIGSEDGGPRVAAIVSIVETCRRHKIPVRDYFGSVLPGLGDFPINRIAKLTPVAWATRN